jgi:hypothetical protein
MPIDVLGHLKHRCLGGATEHWLQLASAMISCPPFGFWQLFSRM